MSGETEIGSGMPQEVQSQDKDNRDQDIEAKDLEHVKEWASEEKKKSIEKIIKDLEIALYSFAIIRFPKQYEKEVVDVIGEFSQILKDKAGYSLNTNDKRVEKQVEKIVRGLKKINFELKKS